MNIYAFCKVFLSQLEMLESFSLQSSCLVESKLLGTHGSPAGMCASIYSRRMPSRRYVRFDLLPPHAIPPRAGSRRRFVRGPRWARFMFARFRKCNVFHFMIYPRTKSSSPLSSPPCPSSPHRKPPFPLPPFVDHVLDTFSLFLLLYPLPCRRLLARTFIRTGFCMFAYNLYFRVARSLVWISIGFTPPPSSTGQSPASDTVGKNPPALSQNLTVEYEGRIGHDNELQMRRSEMGGHTCPTSFHAWQRWLRRNKKTKDGHWRPVNYAPAQSIGSQLVKKGEHVGKHMYKTL